METKLTCFSLAMSHMEGCIQLYRFWNPVLPVKVSVSVSAGIVIGHLKNISISIGLFSGIGASLLLTLTLTTIVCFSSFPSHAVSKLFRFH